jgi:multicomponent K+:H+ antiporter subunit D
MSHLILVPILLPLLTAIVLLLLHRCTAVARNLGLVANLALVPVAALLLNGWRAGPVEIYALGNWAPPFGIVLVGDGLAGLMLLLTAVLSVVALWHSRQGADREGPYFGVFWQLQLMGLNGAFLTGDLFNLFVFFEVLLLASYALLNHGGGRARSFAGLHYVTLNLVGSTLFLFAVGALYGVLGTLNMGDLAAAMAHAPAGDAGVIRAAGAVLLIVFALKSALFPLLVWLPRAYADTSAPVAALFAIMTKVGAYAILRVYGLSFGPASGEAAWLAADWLLPAALLTLALGAFGALAASTLGALIAWLTIASVGTLLAAFGLFTPAGVATGLYYLVHSTLLAGGFFLLLDILRRARPGRGDALQPGKPLAHAGWLGGLFMLAAVGMSGLPPLSGFVGKVGILQAATASPFAPWLFAVILVASLFMVIALARAASPLLYNTLPPDPDQPGPRDFPLGWLGPALLLLALSPLLSVFAGPVLTLTGEIAAQLADPAAYLDALRVFRPVAAP